MAHCLPSATHLNAQRDLRLAEADVAAEQSVHGAASLHVALYFIDASELIRGLIELEPALEVALHIRVGRECVTLDFEPARIQLRELLCHILDRTAHARAGFLPVLAAELIEADGLVVAGRTDVFRDLVELSDRDIENVALVVANFDIVFYRAARFELVYALEYADTVRDMNDIVAAVKLVKAVERV